MCTLDDISVSPNHARDKKGDMGVRDQVHEFFTKPEISSPAIGDSEGLLEKPYHVGADSVPTDEKRDIYQACTISGDALLRAAEDSHSELSDDPAPCIMRELINQPRRREEKFEPHETDPFKINATFHLKLADGSGWYTQRDVLPEQHDSSQEDEHDQNDTLFIPELTKHKVRQKPREKKGISYPPWTKVSAWQWERTVDGESEAWTPNFVLRRFNACTHKYERVYVGETKMANIDPNDKNWVHAYHKWIDQIKRRTDSNWVREKRRDHWTVPEIRAMYAGINDFLRANGIDAYCGISNLSLQPILDAVNAAGNKNRGMDALRGQMNSSHEQKNPSMAYLRDNVQDVVEYLEDGGVLSDAERFPQMFIPEEEFPTAPRGNSRRLLEGAEEVLGMKGTSVEDDVQSEFEEKNAE
jgi:hypothetical protein